MQLEVGRCTSLLSPDDAVMLRDELRVMTSPAATRLATQIDVAVTTLLAAPLHAGTRTVRVASDERTALLEASLMLERLPSDRFATLRTELSGPD